jgi:hypothetical protein
MLRGADVFNLWSMTRCMLSMILSHFEFLWPTFVEVVMVCDANEEADAGLLGCNSVCVCKYRGQIPTSSYDITAQNTNIDKNCPATAMQATRERGGIAPIHS